MVLKCGDTVRVRFDLSKHNGVDKWLAKLKANGVQIADTFPIGYATGTVVRKDFWYPSSREKSPIAVVRFGKNQVICNIYDVSSTDIAVSIAEGPDYYDARIVDEAGSVYTE